MDVLVIQLKIISPSSEIVYLALPYQMPLIMLQIQQVVLVTLDLHGLPRDVFVTQLRTISPSFHSVWPVSPYPTLPILL